MTLLQKSAPPSRREQFNEYFEDHTGWDPSEYPNKSYVEDLWDFFQRGFDLGKEADL